MPVSQTPPPQSHDDVAALVRSAMDADPTRIEILRPGGWSTVFGFQANGRDYVIRYSKIADDFERDQFAARFSSPALPIPAVIALDAYDSSYYAISERVSGSFLDELDASGMERVAPSLIDALDAMRTTDISGTAGFGIWDADGNAPFPSWQDFLLSVTNEEAGQRDYGWRAKLASSTTGMAPFEECLDRLTELFDRIPESRQIVHSDLLNYNVLVEDDRLSGVIDWGCGFYGDHLYDVAWFAFWEPWYPQWRQLDLVNRFLAAFEARGADMTQSANRLRCYMLHIGLGQMRYSAFIENWSQLHLEARRALSIARDTWFDLNETE